MPNTNRKIQTFYTRRESLEELLEELEKFLQATNPKQKIILAQTFMTGAFYEMIIAVEA